MKRSLSLHATSKMMKMANRWLNHSWEILKPPKILPSLSQIRETLQTLLGNIGQLKSSVKHTFKPTYTRIVFHMMPAVVL